MQKITKAIITAAGFGTRFLPATKNVPKELLPVIDKPTIHYTVKSCVDAGITDIIIVTRFGNHAVEDYFDTAPALEYYLTRKSKFKEIEMIREIYSSANFIFVRQDPTLPYGSASPLYSVQNLISKGEPFIYAWGDDIILGENCGVIELINDYKQFGYADIILNCTKEESPILNKLGVVKFRDEEKKIIESIVEKPEIGTEPSNIASVSPYLMHSNIYDFLDPTNIAEGKEFMVTDAIDKLCKTGTVRANITNGKWLTTGDPLNYLKATVEVALTREDLRDDFVKYIKKRFSNI